MDPGSDAGHGRGDGLTTRRDGERDDPTVYADASAQPVPLVIASGWTNTEVSVHLRRGSGGVVRVEGVLCSAPVWFRWDGATLWLVGSGASPVGEDHIRVRVDVGPGVAVAMRSVAATVAYAARGVGTRWDTDIHVAAGARLDWRPEPLILTEHARHETTTTVHVEKGAEVVMDEVVVLGRAGESAGALRSTISVRMEDVPVLLTSIDSSLPAWSGPAGVDGATVVANRLRVADGDTGPAAVKRRNVALLEPAPGCRLAIATADAVAEVKWSLDEILPV